MEPFPFTFTRFRRMYFCARGAGRRGRVLASQRSSRCPASFFPMVNSFMDAAPQCLPPRRALPCAALSVGRDDSARRKITTWTFHHIPPPVSINFVEKFEKSI